MKYHKDLDFFRAILMCLVILIHIVNFGDIYPSTKSAILSFMMPTFLVITGFLVNIDKSVKDFIIYIWQIALPYTIFVVGYAAMSLYLPVRDGIKVFDIATISDILLVKSIGPYWFFHTMIVCGIIYYITFRIFPKIDLTAKYSLFASALIAVSLWTPLLSIKMAAYYFIGVGIRLYVGDFSRIYKKSFWPIIPFGLLITQTAFHDWGAISTLICVLSFLCFSSFFFSFLRGRAEAVVAYIGRNTFPIYIFHPIFTMMSKFLLPLFRFEPSGILHALFTISISIVGSICIAKFLDWSRLSYLLGRQKLLR